MKVLVIGSGGREHALCWKLAQSPICTEVLCAPGNPGIEQVARCVPVDMGDRVALVDLALKEEVGLVVIGPEAPLVMGLADEFRFAGIPTFGPGRMAARLEGSKQFMKDVLKQAGVPTADYAAFDHLADAMAWIGQHSGPLVVKTDGLAAGKGVIICPTPQDALDAVQDMMVNRAFGDAGERVVIEEFLVGEEVSFFVLCDGKTALPMVGAQDHKAAFDGDTGPNTGGMGAYSPTPVFTDALQAQVMDTIVAPTLQTMIDLGSPFQGVLFVGLMLTEDGPKVLEYNVRFGDPECQVLMMRLDSDLLAVLLAAAVGRLGEIDLAWSDDCALVVVMAAEGYPGTPRAGTVIRGLDAAGAIENVQVFHAGTAHGLRGVIQAAGGRVLGIAARGETVRQARTSAYEAVEAIDWPEGFCRTDIAWRALEREDAV